MLILFTANAGWGQFFQQDFGSSATVSSYVGAPPSNGQFDAITTSGAGTVVSINTTGSNKLRYARAGANAGIYVRTTDFSPSPSVLVYKFDLTVSGNTAAQTTAAVWQAGSGFGTANSAEANANVHSRIGLNWTATTGQFSLRNIVSSINSANYTGTQTITWVINKTGILLGYTAPDGSLSFVSDNSSDVWIGTTLELNEVPSTTSSQSLTDIKFAFTAGTGTVDIDNILIDRIPVRPVASPATSVTTNSFIANWLPVSGVTGYRIDVATDLFFTSYVSGYQNVYVPGQATTFFNVNSNINPGTNYYYRIRAVNQFTLGEFASNSSDTITVTTPAAGTPGIALSPNSLTGFTYVAGSGPSGSQTFTVSGVNLTSPPGNIAVTAPADYEVNDGNGWTTSFNIPYTTATLNPFNVDVRLKAGLAVGNYNSELINVSGGGDSKNETVSGNVTLGTPVANPPTVFTANSFTANWNPVPGASAGYLLDVSTSGTFTVPLVIASDGFENAFSLFTQTGGTGSFYSGNSAVGDAPASSPLATAGTYAYGRAFGSVNITSGNINTSSATNVQLSFKLGSFSIGSTANGADATDFVSVEISADGGASYSNIVRVLGNSNAVWAYSATGVASTSYLAFPFPTDFQPAGGGERTVDGYSTVTITDLPSVSNLKVRISLLNNNAAELWVIDDFKVTGIADSYLAGYNGLSVAGTSQAVTVPGPGTYYYRVRATTGSVTSGNSNVISIVMNSQGIAPFRSAGSGDYNSSSTWEFNVSPPSYYAGATLVPGSTNDVTIQNGHTVTLSANSNANNLTLQSTGNIILGTNNLTVNSATGGAAGGFIKTNGTGVLTVNNIAASAKALPVGNSTYNPLTIANGSGHNWSVRLEDAVSNVQSPFNSNKAVNRTWNITPSVNPPAAGADLTFQYDDSDPAQVSAGFNTAEDVQLWHYTVAWVAASGAITPTGTPGSVRTITKTGQTQFSPFAIANVSGPLPVTFLTFSGYRDGSHNQLKWITAAEINNRGFEVQRSIDGIHYSSIGFVNSLAFGGNSSTQTSYSFIDNAPAGDKQYYRLRQEDLNGQQKLSNVILVRGDKPTGIVLEGLFPNPAKNTVNVIVASNKKQAVTLFITDMAGKNINQRGVMVETGSNTIPFDITQLSSGSYLVRLVCTEGCETGLGKFVKE